MEKLKLYEIKVRLSFEGSVEVRANTMPRAKEIVEKYFGGLIGKLESGYDSNDEEKTGISYWEFPVHPDKKILYGKRK